MGGIKNTIIEKNTICGIPIPLPKNSETISRYEDEEILGLMQSQLMDSKRWAIFYSKDGFIDYIMTDEDNDKEYDIKLAKFTKDKNFTVIKSEDVA